MYYIYHIPGVKIGCSQNIKNRIRQQKFSHYEILEEHTDVFVASEREIQLQKENGYKVDRIPYWLSLKRITKAKKIAEQTREKWMPEVIKNMIGRTLSDDTKLKISKNHANCSGNNNSFYGKKHSDEAKMKMRLAKIGKTSNRLGKKHSEETIMKMRLAKLNKKVKI